MTESVREHFSDAEVIAGTATAGIAWAAWVAERLERPMIYVRGEAKGHGRKKRVEGRPLAGERVLVIEDLLSFGGSALSAVDAVNEEGGTVTGVQAIVTWGFPDVDRRFREADVPYAALCDYEALLETLTLSEEQARVLREWRDS